MPERFYDPDFASRIVRLLNLKGGSAPDLVNTEIQITLDLSSLLAKAPDLLSDSVLGAPGPASVVLSKAGVLYTGYFPIFTGAAVGQILVGQVFNPAGSGRVVHGVQHIAWDGTLGVLWRFYHTALSTLHANSPAINALPGGVTSSAQIRRQLIATAGVPPAGAGGIWHYDVNSSDGRDRLTTQAFTLRPGQGIIWYPANDMGGSEATPTPRENIGTKQVITLIEYAEA